MSRIYTRDGKIESLKETFNEKPFFRKMFSTGHEKEIVEILFKNPQPNIVEIYHITSQYFDMELLDTFTSKTIPRKSIAKALEQLHSLNIVYIDLKYDNIGQSKNGVWKLFDFDASGVVKDNDPANWLLKPPEYFYYKKWSHKVNDNLFMFDHLVYNDLFERSL